MKKIKLSVFALSLICNVVTGQNTPLAEPTTGSLSNYVNTAISPATGVPNIGFPIYQLETNNKEFPVNISLSYHVYNAKSNVPASEVGQGWSLFTSGVITREVVSDIDETKNLTDINEEQADLFYYTIPGHSGKFKILKDPATGNPILNNLTGEKVKIDFERNLGGTKFIINSFKITDERGFQYFFEEYNVGYGSNINYKTSFVLTKIIDASDTQLITYSYDKKIKYRGTSNSLKYQYCKINTISTARGKLKFDYSYQSGYEDRPVLDNDPYKLNSVSLTDPADRLISKNQFVYGSTNVLTEEYQNGAVTEVLNSRRALNTIQKLDKNLVVDEETQFEYDTEGSSTQYWPYGVEYGDFLCSPNQIVNPKRYTVGLLKKITFPTKGSVMYDFEASTVYEDKSVPPYNPYVNYYELLSEIPFDTNISNTYQFTVTGSTGYLLPRVIDIYDIRDPRGNLVPFRYTIKNSGNQIINLSSGCNNTSIYVLPPGTYTITISSGGGYGSFEMYKMKNIQVPFKNESPMKAGARIKMIQSFDADGTLVKTKKYEYNAFANSMNSSGDGYSNENWINSQSPYDGFVLYKNVKETEVAGTENNGYIKYYFKTPNDYVSSSSTVSFPYYNFTSGGVLNKKEVYNSQNQLTASSEYEYNFQEIPNVPETYIAMGTTKPSWVQYTKETSKSYLDQNIYQKIKESIFSPDHFQEILSKSISADGDISEVTTKYASEMGNTRFLNKNMISVPLQIESKSNGTVMSQVKTLYDNNTHFYPTSVESTDLNQIPETLLTFDLYDSKGNLLQTTDKSGNSVTTIWGYHQTLPIAQIAGANYNNIASIPEIAAAITASDGDADNPANEGALLSALENLRLATQLQAYSLTTNTYDPLIGVTNTISANGIRQTYEYDASGKLLRVKNSAGQVIKENQYNYKH